MLNTVGLIKTSVKLLLDSLNKIAPKVVERGHELFAQAFKKETYEPAKIVGIAHQNILVPERVEIHRKNIAGVKSLLDSLESSYTLVLQELEMNTEKSDEKAIEATKKAIEETSKLSESLKGYMDLGVPKPKSNGKPDADSVVQWIKFRLEPLAKDADMVYQGMGNKQTRDVLSVPISQLKRLLSRPSLNFGQSP